MVQQYQVTLTLTGKASKLNLAYRSDPPLPPALEPTADEDEDEVPS